MNLILVVAACVGGPADGSRAGKGLDRLVVPLVVEEWAPPSPVGERLAGPLFDDGEIPAFELELGNGDLDALRARPDEWVEGAMVYLGLRFEPVGIRLKGNNSFLPIDEKPSLKVKLDHVVDGLTLYGLHELTLDNMSTDPSMMRERLAYRLFREAGLPASRANHATVRINGEDRGLYTLVENVDDDFLELRYPDPSGAMWEFADVEFETRDLEDFENESGPDDLDALESIADAMSGPDPYGDARGEVDWEQFVDFVAGCAVIGQYDSYPWRSPGDDVHLYFDPADGRMDTIPHGMDETFRRGTRDVFDGGGLLLQACLDEPSCRDDYVDSIWDVQRVSEAFDLEAYARTVRDQIRDLAEADPRRPYTRSEVDDGQDDVIDFVSDRHDELVSQLGRP